MIVGPPEGTKLEVNDGSALVIEPPVQVLHELLPALRREVLARSPQTREIALIEVQRPHDGFLYRAGERRLLGVGDGGSLS